MIDAPLRPFINPPLNWAGKYLAQKGVHANVVTLVGFIIGLIALGLITQKIYGWAAIFITINRLLDGLDGAVARHSRQSDFGGFLDILCDFIIYAGVVFAFGWTDPQRLPAAAFLVFSFVGTITSFLAYAIMAAKNQVHSDKRGKKSFYHLGGICEGAETTGVLLALCLVPGHFNLICWIFGGLCWITTLGRAYCAWKDFGHGLRNRL